MFDLKLTLATIVLLYLTNESFAVKYSQNEINDYYNYCDPSLCPRNKKHIGCVNKGTFGKKCPSDAYIVDLDGYQKRLLLHLHNQFRSTIAAGRTPNYPAAARMGALTWDDELANLAVLNAMSCEIEHDKCRNTRTFAFAGQNLAMGWLLDEHTIDWAIRNFTTEWFIEHRDAHPSIIDAFYRPSGPPVGHFTLMVNDKQSKVGCGLVKFTQKMNGWDYKVHVLACNYSWTNVFTLPVYKRGKKTSECKTGRHYYYDGLCSDSEQIRGSFY